MKTARGMYAYDEWWKFIPFAAAIPDSWNRLTNWMPANIFIKLVYWFTEFGPMPRLYLTYLYNRERIEMEANVRLYSNVMLKCDI